MNSPEEKRAGKLFQQAREIFDLSNAKDDDPKHRSFFEQPFEVQKPFLEMASRIMTPSHVVEWNQ